MNMHDEELARLLQSSIEARRICEMYELELTTYDLWSGNAFVFHAGYDTGFREMDIPNGNVLVLSHGCVMTVG